MEHPFKVYKEHQKSLAKRIRQGKIGRKPSLREKYDPDRWGEIQIDTRELFWNRRRYRHHHIALCELKGKKREEIEVSSEHNRADERYITKIKEEILKEIDTYKEFDDDQNVCSGKKGPDTDTTSGTSGSCSS